MLYEGKAAVRAGAMSDAGQQSEDAVRVIEKGGYCGQSTAANCLASFASFVFDFHKKRFLLVFVPSISNGVSFVCKQNCYRETLLKNETLFACFIFRAGEHTLLQQGTAEPNLVTAETACTCGE
jgi:hypothetical protein